MEIDSIKTNGEDNKNISTSSITLFELFFKNKILENLFSECCIDIKTHELDNLLNYKQKDKQEKESKTSHFYNNNPTSSSYEHIYSLKAKEYKYGRNHILPSNFYVLQVLKNEENDDDIKQSNRRKEEKDYRFNEKTKLYEIQNIQRILDTWDLNEFIDTSNIDKLHERYSTIKDIHTIGLFSAHLNNIIEELIPFFKFDKALIIKNKHDMKNEKKQQKETTKNNNKQLKDDDDIQYSIKIEYNTLTKEIELFVKNPRYVDDVVVVKDLKIPSTCRERKDLFYLGVLRKLEKQDILRNDIFEPILNYKFFLSYPLSTFFYSMSDGGDHTLPSKKLFHFSHKNCFIVYSFFNSYKMTSNLYGNVLMKLSKNLYTLLSHSNFFKNYIQICNIRTQAFENIEKQWKLYKDSFKDWVKIPDHHHKIPSCKFLMELIDYNIHKKISSFETITPFKYLSSSYYSFILTKLQIKKHVSKKSIKLLSSSSQNHIHKEIIDKVEDQLMNNNINKKRKYSEISSCSSIEECENNISHLFYRHVLKFDRLIHQYTFFTKTKDNDDLSNNNKPDMKSSAFYDTNKLEFITPDDFFKNHFKFNDTEEEEEKNNQYNFMVFHNILKSKTQKINQDFVNEFVSYLTNK